jgi:hypothetical protein
MKNRIRNKLRNLHVSQYKKYRKHYTEARHKDFLSFDYLGYSDHCDCYFIGRFQKKNVLFNASFCTLRMHAYNLAFDQLEKAMDEKFPDRSDNFISFHKGDDLNEYFNRPEETRYKDWELQQAFDKEEERMRDGLLNNGIEVQSYIEAIPGYQFGVGLYGAFDCTLFSSEKVLEIIDIMQTAELTDYSSPVYIGGKKVLYKSDLEGIQHSTPLVHLPFQKRRDEKD